MKTNNSFIAAACDQAGEICEMVPLSPAWCASVDAELAATAEADAQPVPDTGFKQFDDLLEDSAEWSGYVEVDTAPYSLKQHLRIVFEKYGIKPPSSAPTLPATAVAEGLDLDGDALEQAS